MTARGCCAAPIGSSAAARTTAAPEPPTCWAAAPPGRNCSRGSAPDGSKAAAGRKRSRVTGPGGATCRAGRTSAGSASTSIAVRWSLGTPFHEPSGYPLDEPDRQFLASGTRLGGAKVERYQVLRGLALDWLVIPLANSSGVAIDTRNLVPADEETPTPPERGPILWTASVEPPPGRARAGTGGCSAAPARCGSLIQTAGGSSTRCSSGQSDGRSFRSGQTRLWCRWRLRAPSGPRQERLLRPRWRGLAEYWRKQPEVRPWHRMPQQSGRGR
jgi:hypothetical protein